MTTTTTTTTPQEMNTALYNASICLMEVYKHLSAVPEFHMQAGQFLMTARRMVDIIVPEDDKISVDRMRSILDEIIGISPKETTQ
jgi:hypothetical protein